MADNIVPYPSPQDSYNLPDYYGGLLTVYPIVTHRQQHGLFREVVQDWMGVESGVYRSGGHGPDAWYDKPNYNGEVWTVQIEARPGYYTTPSYLQDVAITTAHWDSTGVSGGTWESLGSAPYG